jgi:hypothetical protein
MKKISGKEKKYAMNLANVITLTSVCVCVCVCVCAEREREREREKQRERERERNRERRSQRATHPCVTRRKKEAMRFVRAT